MIWDLPSIASPTSSDIIGSKLRLGRVSTHWTAVLEQWRWRRRCQQHHAGQSQAICFWHRLVCCALHWTVKETSRVKLWAKP